MIHAQLDANGICIGYGDLKNIESAPNLVYLPDGWDDDLLWRKYENGAWSAEKFEPAPPTPGTSLEERVVTLDERTVGMQAIDDFTLQQTITMDDRTIGMQAIDDFTLQLVNDQAAAIAQLQAALAALKGGA